MDTSRVAFSPGQAKADQDRPVSREASARSASAAAASAAVVPANDNPVAAAASAQAKQPPLEAMQQLLEQVSRHIDPVRRSLSFEIREELGRTIVSVIDAETEELVRQIPAETLVRIATTLGEIAQQGGDTLPSSGLLFDAQA